MAYLILIFIINRITNNKIYSMNQCFKYIFIILYLFLRSY